MAPKAGSPSRPARESVGLGDSKGKTGSRGPERGGARKPEKTETKDNFGRPADAQVKQLALKKFNTVVVCWDSLNYYERKFGKITGSCENGGTNNASGGDGDDLNNKNDTVEGAEKVDRGEKKDQYLIDKNECIKWCDPKRPEDALMFGPFDAVFWNNTGPEMWNELFQGQVMDLLGEEQASDPKDVNVKPTKKKHTTLITLGSESARKSLFLDDFLLKEFAVQYGDRKQNSQYCTPYVMQLQFLSVTQDNRLIDLLNKGKELTNMKFEDSKMCFSYAKSEEIDSSAEMEEFLRKGRERMINVNDNTLIYLVWKAPPFKGKSTTGNDDQKGVISGTDEPNGRISSASGRSVRESGSGRKGRATKDAATELDQPGEDEPIYKSWLIADLTSDFLKGFKNIGLNMTSFELKQFITFGFDIQNQKVLQNKTVIALTPGLTNEICTEPILMTVLDHCDKMSFGSLEFTEIFLKFQDKNTKKAPSSIGKARGSAAAEETSVIVPWYVELASSEIRKRGYIGRFKESMKGLLYEDERIETSFTMPEAAEVILMLKDKDTFPDLDLLLNASRTELYKSCLDSAQDCLKLRTELDARNAEIAELRKNYEEKEKELQNQINASAHQFKAMHFEKETLRQEKNNTNLSNIALQNKVAMVADIIGKSNKEFHDILFGCYETLLDAFPDEDEYYLPKEFADTIRDLTTGV